MVGEDCADFVWLFIVSVGSGALGLLFFWICCEDGGVLVLSGSVGTYCDVVFWL